MTCTILLMVCTVSFIWGTQSDSVLKEVLSATGNNPRLHKTRDGSDKYERFRKALVRKESLDYTADPPATDPPPIEPCGNTNRACVELERDKKSFNDWSVWKRNYCKCEDGAPDCDETWMIGNDNSVTFKPKDNENKDRLLRFCRNLPDRKKCPSTFGMPHLVSVTGKATKNSTVGIYRPEWIFNPVCKCPFNYFVEYEQKFIRNGILDWSFTCYKPIEECTHNRQVCGIMTRVSGGTPSFDSMCKCTSGDCSQIWEDDGLTLKTAHNYSIEYQYKFCVELPQVDHCTRNPAGILTSTITSKGAEVVVYMPECKCPNKVFLYEVNRTNNTMTFVCYNPIEACIYDRQVCGIMTRVSGGTPSFESKCKCNSPPSGGCNQTWEDDGVTWTAMHDYNIEYQYKFCVELPQMSKCYGNLFEKTAGMLTSTSTSTGAEVMVYTPKCECRNKKFFLYEVNKTNSTVTFVCDKDVASSNKKICAIRYKEYGGQEVDVIRYIRICPESSAQKCLEPEKDGDLGTDDNGKFTYTRCIQI